MKISTEINSAAMIIGEEKTIEYIAEAGFDAWDFSLFEMCRFDHKTRKVVPTDHPLTGNQRLAFARRLKQIGLDSGIVCNQSHAPFPVSCPEIRSLMKSAIECTAEAGGQYCIIHPDNNKSAEQNAEMLFELIDFARECNVKIATENMWNWNREKGRAVFAACATAQSFCEHIDVVNSDSLVACLDIGHAEMMGDEASAPDMIRALGPRLQALHIHDNDKIHDSHQIPFSMSIDFDAVVKALRDIGYSGYFTLEADQYLSAYTTENIQDGIKKLAESAKRLAMMFEQK